MTTVEVEAEILTKTVWLQTLQSGVMPKKNEGQQSSFHDNPFRSDKPIAALIPFGRRNQAREIKLMKGAEEYLWLAPVENEKTWTATDLKEQIYSNPPLNPLGRVTSTWHERNEFGAIVFQESAVNPGAALNLSQVFTDGGLLGIDRFLLNAEHLREFSGADIPYIPSVAFEEDFERALRNYLNFVSKTLAISPPYRFRAGLAGVKGYAMAVRDYGDSKFRGQMVNDDIYLDGEIADAGQDVQQILLPFFEHVWSECGIKRPRNHRFKANENGD